MKYALFNNGPVIATLPLFSTANPDIFWKPLSTSSYSGFHCITIVGYDDLKQQFLIRNSWGTKWGINGYQWFPYTDYNFITEAWTLLPATIQPSESIYSITTLNNETKSDEILGIESSVFYYLLAGGLIFIILILIINIIRYKQNNKIKIN